MTHPYTDLKEAAMKVSLPGPWHFYSGSRAVWSRGVEPEKSICVITGPYRVKEFPGDRLAIGTFIALANPTRILSLIEENERMREALERLVRRIDDVSDSSAYHAVWSELVARGRPYSGPNFEMELNDARAALKEKP